MTTPVMDVARSLTKQAVFRASERPDNSLRPHEAEAVAKAVADDLAPALVNVTNNESWFESRVTLGSLATILSSGFAFYAMVAAGITDGELLAPPLGAIAGAAFALYGRWKARKPLGS